MFPRQRPQACADSGLQGVGQQVHRGHGGGEQDRLIEEVPQRDGEAAEEGEGQGGLSAPAAIIF